MCVRGQRIKEDKVHVIPKRRKREEEGRGNKKLLDILVVERGVLDVRRRSLFS
jgi:hypothetical protein